MNNNVMLEKDRFFQISKQEKDILYPLYDFLNKIVLVDCNSCESCDPLYECLCYSWADFMEAFQSILQKILIRYDLSHLNPLVEKINADTIPGIIFAETPEGQFYMSLSGIDD